MHSLIKLKLNKGFTLIELLVVVAIIGLLSSVVLASLNTARAKARDVRRVSDMKALQTALELYANDHGGDYFSTGGSSVCLGVSSSEQCWGGPYGNDALNLALKPYLTSIPKDPLYGSRIYGTYIYTAPGSWWLPYGDGAIIGTGKYSLSFVTDIFPNNDSDCLRWKWAAWDGNPPGPHCPVGGSCRQCGYLSQ